jgi:RND family efflux transporter MFP subunit
MSKRRLRRRIAFVVIVLLGGAGLVLGFRHADEWWPRDPLPTYEVTEQPFARKITAEGNLRAVKATPLVAPPESSGPIKIAWLAPEGSRLAEGDLVVRFDASEMQRKLDDGRAAQDAAESKIARERIMVESTLRNRDRTSALSQKELETTRAFQRKDELIFSRDQIIESEIDEGLSTAKMDHAQGAKGIEKSLSKSKLDLLAIERRAATLKVDQARKGLEELTVSAPHAGVLVLKRDWRGNQVQVGDAMWPGQPIAEIPLVSDMEAEVFVLEADASGLEAGKPATVVIEAYPGTEYKATIKRVDTLAKPRVKDVPVQYFRVTLELERTEVGLMKHGQRVRAQLVLDDRPALVVPRQAVFEKDGKPVVYRQGAQGFEPVEVELGASSPGRVVIDKGLAAGDRIALRDPTRPLDQGDKGDEAREGAPSPSPSPSPSSSGGAR